MLRYLLIPLVLALALAPIAPAQSGGLILEKPLHPAERVQRADWIVVGTVNSVEWVVTPTCGHNPAGRPKPFWTTSVQIDQILKGKPAGKTFTIVHSPLDGLFEAGNRAIFYLRRSDPRSKTFSLDDVLGRTKIHENQVLVPGGGGSSQPLKKAIASIREMIARPDCPRCEKPSPVVPIVYGKQRPPRPGAERAGHELVRFGGCVVRSARWHCLRCRWEQ